MGNKFAFPVLRPVSVLYPDEIIIGQSPADASHAILPPAFGDVTEIPDRAANALQALRDLSLRERHG